MSAEMKREFAGVKTRLAAVETRLDGVETRLTAVETRLDGIEKLLSEMKAMFSRFAVMLTKTSSDLAELKAKTATKEEVGQLKTSMDAFAAEIERSRQDRLLHGKSFFSLRGTLDDHERRLLRLEAQRA